MNDFNNLKPTDLLIWLSIVFSHENVMIAEKILALNEENLKINIHNADSNKETLNTLKNIEKCLLTLIEKFDEKK